MGRYGLTTFSDHGRGNPAGMSREDAPSDPTAEQLAEQMREATERLRGQGWKVAPLTPAPDENDVEPGSSDTE